MQTGGLASGGYFDKVEIGIRGDAEGVFDAHDAYLFATWSDQTDFRYADALVDTGLSADGASLVRGQCGPTTENCRVQLGRHHAISERPCMKQGPMPTDHGLRRLRKPQNEYPEVSVTGPLSRSGQRWEWDSTCCPWRTPGRSCVPV